VVTSRMMIWVGHVAHIRDKKNAYRFLVGASEGNRCLGSHRCKYEDNTKVAVKKEDVM
jgi:hypothetical protein